MNLRFGGIGVSVMIGFAFVVDLWAQSYNVVQPQNTVSIIAGSGAESYSGDNGAAIFAGLNQPRGVAIDSVGNLYIADTGNHVVRRVDAETGIITTIAGTGEAGYSGDDVPATTSQLSSPEFVAVDQSGNVYLSDTGNHRLRKIDKETGVITTVVGHPDLNPGDIAIDDLNNIVYFVDRTLNTTRLRWVRFIIKVLPSGESSTYLDPDNSTLRFGTRFFDNIAVDPIGNVFLRHGFSSGGIIGRFSRVSGTQDSIYFDIRDNPSGSFWGINIRSFAIDSKGMIYYSGEEFSGGRKLVWRYGTIELEGGFHEIGAEAITEDIYGEIYDMIVDREDNVIFADTNKHQIVRITTQKGFEPNIDAPTAINVGDAIVGATKTQSFNLVNSGNMSLTVQQITAKSDQLSVSPVSGEISRGGEKSFEIVYTPKVSGRVSEVISILNTDPDESTLEITVTGEGFNSEIGLDLELGQENRETQILKGLTGGDTVAVQIFTKNTPAINGFSIQIEIDGRLVESPTFEVASFVPGALPITTFEGNSVSVNVASIGGNSSQRNGLLGILSLVLKSEFTDQDSTHVFVREVTYSLADGVLQGIAQTAFITLSTESALVGDFDGDGSVGFTDFLLFAQNFGKSEESSDFDSNFDLNNDGSVGFPDFLQFAQNFGKSA